jgi:hypothetical protein
MINPLKSEEDAFRFTLIVLALLAPVVIVAVAFSTEAALALAGGLAAGLLIGLFVLKRDEPRAKASLRPRRDDGTHRVLVVANQTLCGRALYSEIGQRRRDDTELRVVVPALNSKLKHWTNEEDGARETARRRLSDILAELRGEGFDAQGDIGEDDPIQAMEDTLRLFPADEVIVSTHPPGRSNWLEHDVIARAQERFDVPVVHVVVDLEQERAGAPAE